MWLQAARRERSLLKSGERLAARVFLKTPNGGDGPYQDRFRLLKSLKVDSRATVRFGSEAAGRGFAGGVAAIVRSGTQYVAAISISIRVRRSYSAKNRRSY